MNMEKSENSVIKAVKQATSNLFEVKKCQKCGAALSEDSAYCEECGAPVVNRCPKCNKEIGYGKKFCKYCGEKQL